MGVTTLGCYTADYFRVKAQVIVIEYRDCDYGLRSGSLYRLSVRSRADDANI